MLEFTLLLGPALLAWFAYDAMRVREMAIGHARGACERQGLQFLDFTVQGARLGLARNADGRAVWRRTYAFEFSEDGRNRRAGTIVMLGGAVQTVEFEAYPLP